MARFVAESSRGRRIVGALDRGEDLVGGLLTVCNQYKVRCGTLQASGTLQELHLSSGGRADRIHRYGAVQVILVSGVIAEHDGKLDLRLNVMAARRGGDGLELVGGRCSGGKVTNIEFVIEVIDDLILRRGLDVETGLMVWNDAIRLTRLDVEAEVPARPKPKPRPSPAASSPPSSMSSPSSPEGSSKPSWADAVMASVRADAAAAQRVQPQDDDEPFRLVRVGDILEHQKFGRCVVQRVDGDMEYATVRLRNDRLVRLNLDVLNLKYTGEEDGHQVFKAAPSG